MDKHTKIQVNINYSLEMDWFYPIFLNQSILLLCMVIAILPKIIILFSKLKKNLKLISKKLSGKNIQEKRSESYYKV